MDRGAWQATVNGISELDMIEHARMLSYLDATADKFLVPKVRSCNAVKICITRSCKV